ncbi:uncharacterized protein LOC119687259 [Teleopsis dalmanni]|uniref:uncharacterized protein LOC119687259 n=1 Tax=Teleopsis dalmanni TaxID=139649 RepID=UPI0018CEA8CF|nr:uncharacterized protein LOC119687259 [Teleopsis dalmanni]
MTSSIEESSLNEVRLSDNNELFKDEVPKPACATRKEILRELKNVSDEIYDKLTEINFEIIDELNNISKMENNSDLHNIANFQCPSEYGSTDIVETGSLEPR